MNRENKFRGIIKDTNRFIYGHIYYGDDKVWITDSKDINLNTHSNIAWFEVIPEIVGQFTGLNDKNGVDIYEGDILKLRYYPLGANSDVIEYYKIGVVVYAYNSFGLCLKLDCTNILDENKKLSHQRNRREIYKHPTQDIDWINISVSYSQTEIIGNIHQHPHLLKN